jgi:hypothetical protein
MITNCGDDIDAHILYFESLDSNVPHVKLKWSHAGYDELWQKKKEEVECSRFPYKFNYINITLNKTS